MPAFTVPVFFNTETVTPAEARDAVAATLEGFEFDNSPDYLLQILVGNENEVFPVGAEPAQRLRELLDRAHQFLCHTTEAQTRDYRHDLIDDIRLALDLDLTDCENCDAVIPTAEAIEKGARVLCSECAALEE